jgi:hypothetical protein
VPPAAVPQLESRCSGWPYGWKDPAPLPRLSICLSARSNFLRMGPDQLRGRDLDAMVARHVFGLPVEQRTNSRTGERDFLYAVHPGQWVRVPFYTASMGASITVEVEMQKRGWKRIVLASHERKAPNEAHVVLVHSDGREVSAAGLLNEALCRAALKAVEQTG